MAKKHHYDIQFNWSLFRVLLVEIERLEEFFISMKISFLKFQGREVTVDDVKRVYEVFLDEARSSDNLREYEQYFMFNDLTSMYFIVFILILYFFFSWSTKNRIINNGKLILKFPFFLFVIVIRINKFSLRSLMSYSRRTWKELIIFSEIISSKIP